MTTLLETMARAAHERMNLNFSAWVLAQGKDPATVELPQLKAWEDLTDAQRKEALAIQRAALTAAREPTEAMTKKGGEWWYATLHNSKGQEENGTIIWLSMIDAALGEKQP